MYVCMYVCMYFYRLQQKVQKEREQALQAIHVEEKHYEHSLKQLRESLADLVVNRCYLLYACMYVCI
jgi:hypothetical protein